MTDFQAAASQQGRAFEDVAVAALTFFGWTVSARRAVVHGVEVDIVATDPDGQEWWVEVKGSHRGKTPGASRGDTVKKAIGVGWFLSMVDDPKPHMLVTSHLPKPGSVPALLLAKAQAAGLFQRIQVLSLDDQQYADDLPDGDTP